jgi:hypothetical protein
MTIRRRGRAVIGVVAALAAAAASGAAALADTLVLRDGARVHGELLTVRGDVIEFRERRSSGWRTVRLNRWEVERIEFGDDGGGPNPIPGYPGQTRPPGMRERTVDVGADVPWNDSGIDVRTGQTIYFEASGRIRWGPDRRDGPDGEDNSPHNPQRPIPNRPGGSLIGRIGPSADYFFIGAGRGPIRMRGTGRLFLGVNDDYLQDNSGAFRVIVHY